MKCMTAVSPCYVWFIVFLRCKLCVVPWGLLLDLGGAEGQGGGRQSDRDTGELFDEVWDCVCSKAAV
jgi:hypothetical protein